MRTTFRVAAGYLLVLIAVPLLVAALRAFVVDTALVHTRSMLGTLIPGDVVLINKLPYGPSTPAEIPFTSVRLPTVQLPAAVRFRPGDVVLVHRSTAGEGPRRLLKRIVGVPGDSLVIRHGLVLRNGTELPLPPGGAAGGMETIPPFRIPLPGDTITLTPTALSLFGNAIAADTRDRAGEPVPLPGSRYRVRDEWFYLLGDNRGNSVDSRSWGCVTRSEVVGRSVMVFWSRDADEDGWFSGIRWDRICTIVR